MLGAYRAVDVEVVAAANAKVRCPVRNDRWCDVFHSATASAPGGSGDFQ